MCREVRRQPPKAYSIFVRIESVSIQNFRGLRNVLLDGLADTPVVTVSGRNGSGKSLILEAIGLAWRIERLPSGITPQFWLGSWGSAMAVHVSVKFDADERDALAAYGAT